MSEPDESDPTLDGIREMRLSAGSSTGAETMAVYEEIDALLKSGRTDEEWGTEVQDLVGRLVELHKIADAEDLERAALWAAEHPIPWTGGMAA